jgi:hypothetical protein
VPSTAANAARSTRRSRAGRDLSMGILLDKEVGGAWTLIGWGPFSYRKVRLL